VSAAHRIETTRLLLRPPEPGDAQAIFDGYASDPEVTRYLGWPRHHTVADTDGFIAFSAAEWQRWPAGPYLIHSRAEGRLLGGTGLAFESDTVASTGYVLATDAWGRGYATEALAAIVDLASGLGVQRLYALCHPDHRRSHRVLEKCGFQRDHRWTRQFEFPNLAAGVMQDVVCYVRAADRPRRA
jgi:RimJ/RimL family protein N-acetyltransferase